MRSGKGDGTRIIGKHWRKVDAKSKCTGQTLFADDLAFPRMLFCKILRSRLPHAKLKKVDVSRAARLPGVVATLVGTELPVKFGILPVSEDEHALAIDTVRYVGDGIAAVAAEDEETAERAIELVDVAYEPMRPIMSPEEAIANPRPQIHDYADEGNCHRLVSLAFGDVEEGYAEADAVVEGTYFYEGNTHLPMEQHSAVAATDPEGRVTLWSSTQTPHYVHKAMSKVLGIPPERIRVVAMPNGGGFGGKSDPFGHEMVVAKLALKTGRPVKVTLTREEVFYAHRGRHPVLMRCKTGVTKKGEITGMHFQTFLDGGAYGSYGVASTYYTGALQTVTYNVKRYKFEGLRAFTNKPPCGPKRGHGTPQPRFALEVQMDRIAEKLGLDPAEMRLANLVPPDSVTANYLKVGSMGLGECIRRVVEGSRWKERFRKMPAGRGLGIACSSYISGAGLPIYWNKMPHSGVMLKFDRGGGVTAYCGATDIGQGSDSVLAYIVAEVLGIDPLDIKLVMADTDLTPVDLGSYSSRVTLMMGNAAIQAAERARELLATAVSEKLQIPKGNLVFADRRVFDMEDSVKGVDIAEAIQLAESEFGTLAVAGSYAPPPSPARFKGGGVGPSPAYSYSACVVETAVDRETGIVTVEKIWIAHDCGQPINPTLVIGQVEGSVYMGLGEALMEEQVFRKDVHKAPSLLEYKSPTTMEMPDVVTYLVGEKDPNGPFGAKEAGQGPLLPVPPAIANAVYDAVRVRIDEVPITPEKVLKALKLKEQGKEGRYGPSKVPQVNWPEPILVPPPWEGGDGKAVAGEAERRARIAANPGRKKEKAGPRA